MWGTKVPLCHSQPLRSDPGTLAIPRSMPKLNRTGSVGLSAELFDLRDIRHDGDVVHRNVVPRAQGRTVQDIAV